MRQTEHGHDHGEAFMLMSYACKECGHRETIWNSRDGVTPFCIDCPSCGETGLQHVNWRGDVYAPDHRLHDGQRFFRNGTPDEAEAIMRNRIEAMRPTYPMTPEYEAELIQSARAGDWEFAPGWPKLDRFSRRPTTTRQDNEAWELAQKAADCMFTKGDDLHTFAIGVVQDAIMADRRASRPAAVPEGWRLVPEELTGEMKNAWMEEITFADGYRAMLAAAPAAPQPSTTDAEPDWRDDPAADERWSAGLDYAMTQLCGWTGADPKKVVWDAATETLEGDVWSVIGNIMRTAYGEDFPHAAPQAKAGTEELVEALRKLVFMARTSGGTVGPDQGLKDACTKAETLLTAIAKHGGRS